MTKINVKKQLIELLQIHSPSGKEKKVRDYLMELFRKENIVDNFWLDGYGNLLAEKKCGDGEGAVVILSSHMDTVRGVIEGAEIIEEDGIVKAIDSALGGDDKNGITAILTILRLLDKMKLAFNGTLKIAFSVEEEIGCKGASKIDTQWIQDSDLAIVFDRRGNSDIVVGCMQAFCSDEVGEFFETASDSLNFDYKCVHGGISDAVIFSELGVNSVNISVGFYNEHTKEEYSVIKDIAKASELVFESLRIVNDYFYNFRGVPVENKWVNSWIGDGNSKYSNDDFLMTEDIFDDEYGTIEVDDLGDCLSLKQDGHEVLISKEVLEEINKKYL